MSHRLGVHPQTLRRWSRNGSFTEASRTVGGHRRYQIDAPTSGASGACVGYARVSSHDQKNDLGTQVSMLKSGAESAGNPVAEVVTDIGSGMNMKKRGFLKLMGWILSGRVSHLVLLHRDRLLRFGADLVFLVCRHLGVKITILEPSPAKNLMEQLATDLVEIVTVFSSRLYGMRSHQNRKSRNAQVCSTTMAAV